VAWLCMRVEKMSFLSLKKPKEMIVWSKTHLAPACIDMSLVGGGNAPAALISSILNAVPHAVVGIRDGEIFFANGAVEAVFGWKPDELIGHSGRMLYQSEDEFDEMGTLLYSILENHNTYTKTLPFDHRDGRTVICRIHISRIGDDLINKMFVATFEDVTEQHEKELKLKQLSENMNVMVQHSMAEISTANERLEEQIRSRGISEDRLRRAERGKAVILDAITDHILLLDKDMRIIWTNSPLENHFRTDHAALMGTYCYERLYGKTEPCNYCPAVKAIRAMKPYNCEHVDATGRSWVFRGYPICDDDGQAVGAVEIVTDITERKRFEEERRKLTDQLSHAQKMESIGTLAGGIAHDFNNILMGIQSYTSLMLLALDKSHPHYDQLEAIETQVQSGADLTKQLLGFARGGRFEVVPTNINALISKTATMFGRTKKEILIHKKLGNDLWTVAMDRGQMEQVFLNLFVNAWQAMPGGGSLYLETQNIILDDFYLKPYNMEPGPYVKISVTDTGSGMDESTVQRIFDPFFTTKEMGRGTGLGLASAYGIIKGHGGVINVYSEKGHGSTFNIYLPASKKKLVEKEADVPDIVRGNGTVLVVDDEQFLREGIGAMVERLGYSVVLARSGQDAVDVYRSSAHQLDLVIMDMIMPGMGGGEAFDALKAINPEVRVILSSGYSMDGRVTDILDRGARAFLQKPFRLNDLSRKIREVLETNS